MMSLEGGQDRHHAGSAVGLLLPSQTCEILAKRHLAQPQGAPFTRLPVQARSPDAPARQEVIKGISHAVSRDKRPVQQRHAVQVGERHAAQVGVDRVRKAGEGVHVLQQEALR